MKDNILNCMTNSAFLLANALPKKTNIQLFNLNVNKLQSENMASQEEHFYNFCR